MIGRISTHVLDTQAGRPAVGIPVGLHVVAGDGSARRVGGGITDDDGRVGSLTDDAVPAGSYRLVFDTVDYFVGVHRRVFYPRITVEVYLDGARSHYHVPVLASLYSYTTYLGS
jgi:5-hydroxyisourate hydrolase